MLELLLNELAAFAEDYQPYLVVAVPGAVAIGALTALGYVAKKRAAKK